jgi:hypothetical protein
MRATIVIVALALSMVGCEDGAVLPPQESTLTIAASPTTINIQTDNGETEGKSNIVVSIFDAQGFPASGVDVVFTTTAGALASNPPGSAPNAQKTNVNGYAFDVLTMSATDPGSADVVAIAGTLTGSVTVLKTTDAVNERPVAAITVTPTSGAVCNQDIRFDGSNSADPEGDDITCYKWTIDDAGRSTEVVQGTGEAISITKSYPADSDLAVTLQVSDEQAVGTPFCRPCTGPPTTCGDSDQLFGTPDAIPSYTVCCEPTAEAGDTVNATIPAGEDSVDVPLTGTYSANGTNVIREEWRCTASTGWATGNPRICVYTTPGNYTATYRVTTDCGNTQATDTVTVNVTRGQ